MTDPHADDERIDFSPLETTADGARQDALARAIAARAAPFLELRRNHIPFAFVLPWARPALAAAAAIVIVSLASLGGGPRSGAPPVVTSAPAANASVVNRVVGVPASIARFVNAEQAPQAEEVLLAMQGYVR